MLERGRNRRCLGFRLFDADVWLQPRDDLIEGLLSALFGVRFNGKRGPQRFAKWKRKPFRHHANDRALDAAGSNRSSDDVARTAEAIAPQVVAKEYNRLGADPIVALAESAAKQRLDAQRVERFDGQEAAAERSGVPLRSKGSSGQTVLAKLLK